MPNPLKTCSPQSRNQQGNMSRKTADFYPTPKFYVNCLIDWARSEGIDLNQGLNLEPFAGDHAIIKASGLSNWVANDLHNYGEPLDYRMDLTQKSHIDQLFSLNRYGAVITNPPYFLASDLYLLHKMRESTTNMVALMLRQNWLNPGSNKAGCNDRGRYLSLKPPSAILTMPRVPFTTNKQGKPATDSCNHAWFIWAKGTVKNPIQIYTSENVDGWMPW